MKTIEIVVSPEGQIRVETKGFTGQECRQASEFLEKALGQGQREELTAEFHATAATTQSQQEKLP